MKLVELDIRRLPGIEPGFRFRPAADTATVVTGPNASGKSSLGRALKALLYPDPADGYCDLGARFETAGERNLEVRRRGDQVSWHSGERSIPPPELPAADYLEVFLVHAEDLAEAGRTESRIAGRIQTLLAGGYDLDAVLDRTPLKLPSRPRKLAGEYAELAGAVDERERAYARLAGELDRIDVLQGELDDAIAAQARLEACNRALELCRASNELAATRVALDDYPEGMDHLRGDELRRLEELEERLAERRGQIRSRQRALEQARAAFAETGIDDPEAVEVFRKDALDARQRLGELEERRAELRRAGQDHEFALSEARRRAGGEIDLPADDLDAPRLEELERRVDQVRSLREQFDSARRQYDRLEARGAEGGRIDPLNQACQSLRHWLRRPSPSQPELTVWIFLAALGLIGSATVLATGFQLPVVLLMLLAVAVPGARLFMLAQRWQEARAARALYPENHLEPPVGWTWPEVQARLEDLEAELAEVRQAHQEQARFTALGEELERLKPELRAAEEALEACAEKLGLATEVRLSSGFLLWTRALFDWQQAARRQAGNRRHQAEVESETRALIESVRERFTEAGQPPPEPLDHAGLGRYLNQLDHTLSQAHAAANAIEQAERRIAELEDDSVELEQRRGQLFAEAGLPGYRPESADEFRARLVERLERLDRYSKLSKRQTGLELQIEAHRQALDNQPDLLEQADGADLAGLVSLKESLAGRAARRDELSSRIAEIKSRHHEVLKRRELEQLNLGLQASRQSLSDALDEMLLAQAGAVMVEQARATHRNRHQPRVLNQATEWFARFTRDAYALVFDGEQFSALDTRRNRHRSLQQLSTGTRIQLLLAVRLAWIDEAERGRERLPVFLDEVLATSDPDRYRSVVETVQELVRDGRQIIYLSAQPADAEAWERFGGRPRPVIQEMAALRRGRVAPGGETFDFVLPEKKTWPDPTGLGDVEWARQAGIPAIDPWADAGAIDAFHLLRDRLDRLVELKDRGLETLGELESRLARPGADAIGRRDRELLKQRIAAARAFLEQWRRGRSRPVTAAVLAESGVVSERFLEPVAALAAGLDGDPVALLEALRERRVKRFLSRNIEQLEEWLSDNGYLDPGSPPDDQEITEAMVAASGLDSGAATELREWLGAGLRSL